MKFSPSGPITGLVLGMTIFLSQSATAQELINRREQARSAFLATPQGIYQNYCAHCHGDEAEGGGRFWVTELSPSPPDLTTLQVDKTYLVTAIRDGSAAHGKSNLCPPWGATLSSRNVERLAQYILSLDSEETPPESSAPLEPVRQSFPWFLVVVFVGELALLWRLVGLSREP